MDFIYTSRFVYAQYEDPIRNVYFATIFKTRLQSVGLVKITYLYPTQQQSGHKCEIPL